MTRREGAVIDLLPSCVLRAEPLSVGRAARRGPRVCVQGDRGATAVEYALMATLIAVVLVGVVAIFGQDVAQLFGIPPGYL